MPINTWLDGTSGDWGTVADWSGMVVPDATSNATITGSGTETVTVSADEAVNVLTLDDANATVSVMSGATLSVFGGVSVSAIHEIDVDGTLLFGGSSQTIDNSTINLGQYSPDFIYGTLTTDTASPTSEVLTLGPNLIVNAAYGAIQSGTGVGDGIDNQGTINVTGTLSISGDAFTNEGAISGNGSLGISGSSITNDNGKTISAGTVSITSRSAGTGSITNDGTISGQSVSINDNYGAFTNQGTISGDTLFIGASNGAAYSNPFVNNAGISGRNLTIDASEIAFTNNATITASGIGGSGEISYYGPSFDNEGTITVTNGDTLNLIDNAYTTANNNNGTISAGSGGRLVFSGNLGGTGNMVINDAGTLELSSGTLADQVSFAGVGNLQLDAPGVLTGTISGLADGDVIDFKDTILTSAVANGTTLTVTLTGGQTENFTLAAALPAGYFVQRAPDGASGTDVVVTPTTLPTVTSVVTSGTGITNGNGDLNASHVVTLTVHFSDTVVVNVVGGAPTLALNDGGTAKYIGGSGSSALTFSYLVGAGENTSDLTVNAVSLNGAIIPADLTGANSYNPAGILQIDNTPPTVTEALTVDTGSSPSDKITSNPALTGGGDPNAVVTLTEGTTTLGTRMADGSGVWSFTPSLSDGPHTIVASETDGAGNTGSTSLTFTLDTTPPAVTVALKSDTGSSSSDKFTSNPALTGGGDQNAVVTLKEGATTLGTTTAAADGTWGFTPVGLADGSHTIVASETDTAGNTGSAPLTFTFDRDLGEQAALSLTVNGGVPIGAGTAGAVPFTVSGLESDDSGSVTFSDGTPAHNVVVNIVAGAPVSSTANLSGLTDGGITATLHLNNDVAGNSFTDVVIHPALDQDLGEQAALSLTINGGATVQVAMSGAVPFTIGGLDADDSGSVTFSDGNPAHNVVVNVVAGVPVSSTANLLGLNAGNITASLSASDPAGNAFTANASNAINNVPTAVSWANGINGAWQTASDWNPVTVPWAANSAFITAAGTYTVTDPQTTTVYSVATAAGATLDITGGTFTTYAGTGSGANAGIIKVETGATLDVLPSAVTNTGVLNNAGTLNLNHTTITGGTLSNSGTVDVTGGTTSTLNGVKLASSSGTGSSAGVLAIDGNRFVNKPTATTSASLSLTTANANDVIIVDVVQNGTSVSSVSDAAGLVWHARAIAGTAPFTIYEYYAIAPNALSSDAITVNFAGTASYADVNAFGVSGANTASPFDSNVSVPATPANSTGSITTSNANDLIIAGYRFGGNATPVAGAGWTAINASGGYYLSEYQIVSATQAGLVATASTADQSGGIVDAIAQAPASAPTPPGALTVDAGSTLDLNNTTISGGTLTNFGTVDIIGAATSTLSVVGVTDTSAILTVDAGSTLDLKTTTISGGTLTNFGTVDIIGGTTSTLNGVGVTDTAGTVKVDAGTTLGLKTTTIGGGTLTNAGTVDVTGGATSTLNGVSVTNTMGIVTTPAPLVLDGNGFANNAAASTSTSVSLTTSSANDVIILDILQNGTTVSLVSDTAGLVWHPRAVAGAGGQTIYEYYAIAPNALSPDVITVTFAGAASYVDLNAFGVSGANTSSPFDSNVSVPATPATSTGSITTSNANDFIFAGYRFGGTVMPTAGAGWTAINASGGYYMSEYQIASATQAGLVATASTVDEYGGIVDAIVQASTPATTGGLTVDAGSTLDLNNTTINGGSLTGAGTVDVTGGATSTLSGASVTGTVKVDVGSTLDLKAATISGALTNLGTVDVTGGNTSTFNGASITNASGPGTLTGSLALDGNGFSNIPGSTTSSGVTLTTSSSNDVIVLDIVQNGTTVSSVSDTAGLVWHQRAVAGTAPFTIYEYYAIAPNALSADAITVNFAGTASYVDVNAFGVSGANTSSPFDGNASAPATPATSSGTISTSNANDFIFAGYRFGTDETPTAGATWSAINAGSNFYLSEYQIVSATQAGLLAAASTTDQTGGIIDAIVQATIPAPPGALTVDAGSTLNLNHTTISGGTLSNLGTVDVTGGAVSTLNGVGVTDTGTILKVDAGATLDLTGTTISGGTLTNLGTLDVTSGNASTLAGVGVADSSAMLKVDASATLDLNHTTITGGTLSNSGTVDVTGGAISTLNGVAVTNGGGTGTGAGALAIDGNRFVNKSTATTSASVSLTTANANDVIIVDVVQNGTSVSSVSDAAGLVWHARAIAGTPPFATYEYYAIAPNALSSDAITVNFVGTASYVDVNAFGVSGANTASPFDSNVSVPATPGTSVGSITTSNANDIIFAGYRFGSNASPVAGAGWTAINASGNYYLSEYKIVSATQAGLVATASTGDQNGGIVDAIAQAPASAPTAPGALTVDAGSTLDLNHTTISGGTLTNSGTVDVTGGAISTLSGVGVTDTSAILTVDAGSTLDLKTTTISGGTLTNFGTVDIIGATTSTLNGVGVTDTGATVMVDAGTTLGLKTTTVSGGTLTNAGAVDVTGGATSTLNGVSVTNTAGTVTATAPLALDGNGFSTGSASVSLTTSSANDVIILDILQNSTTVSLVSDAAGLVWHPRAVAGAGGQTVYEYYAIAPNVLSADVITVNFAGTPSYVDLNAFAVSGANTSSPFDSNVSVPASPATSTGSISTSNANDFIFAGYRFGGTFMPAAGAGWTAINASGNYYMSEYKVVSATQAGLVATASVADETGGIIDAIVQNTAPPATGGLTVDAGSTLDLNNTTINGGSLTGAGTVDVTGGATSTLSGASVTMTSGTVKVDAGSTLDLAGTAISGGTLNNAGTLDVTGGTASTFTGVGVTDTGGALTVDAGSTLNLNHTTISGGTLSNLGTVDVTGGAVSTLNGVGVTDTGTILKVDAGATLDLTGTTISGGTLTNLGTLDVTSGNASTLAGVGVADSSAMLKVDASATLDLNHTTITGGTLSNSGTVDVTGGAISTLNGVAVTNGGGTGTGAGALAIDGNRFVNKSTATTSASVSLTTANANDVIIVDVVQNGTSVSSVSDAAGLVWHARAIAGTPPFATYEYYAIAPNALSSDAITVNFVGTASYVDVNAFGVSGANTASPFDSNVSVPATPGTSVGSITTSNANDIIFAGYRFGSNASPVAGAGWTAINASGNYYLSEYKIVSATQAGLVATASTGDQNGGIVDAIAQAPASAPTAPGALTVDAGSTLDLNHTTISGGTLTNSGTVDVTGGAISTLSGVGVTDTSAILTVDAGSTLDLKTTTISGGTLTNFGTVDIIGATTSTLNGVGVTDTGATVMVDAGTTLGLKTTTVSGGTLTNAGTVDVTGGATSTLNGVSVTNTAGTVTATAPLALDGNGFTINGAPSSISTNVTLTTSSANDVIILDIVQNGTTVSSVTDAAGLVWHQRAVAGAGGQTIYEYYAIAPNALSSDPITVTFAGTPFYTDLNAFAVSGANTSSPFDSNVSVPASPATSTGSISTSNANDFIFAGYRFGGNVTPTAGAGWTAINASGGYYLSEYQIVSATQAGLVATASSADEYGGIVDAIVQGTAPATTGGLTVDAGSTLDLNNTTINGGSLSNSGTVDLTGTSTLNGVAVTNSGTLEATGGTLNVSGPVTNTGNLLANGGTLDIAGAVTGSGTATISGTNSVLEFGAASPENTTFSPSALGMLKLDNPSSFTGTVAGLATGDSIDLTNFLFSGGPTIAGVIGTGTVGSITSVTVHDGALTDTLQLLNQFANQFAINPLAYSLVADNNTPTHGTLFQLAAAH